MKDTQCYVSATQGTNNRTKKEKTENKRARFIDCKLRLYKKSANGSVQSNIKFEKHKPLEGNVKIVTHLLLLW